MQSPGTGLSEEELMVNFDRLSADKGYSNRSEALRDLMRDALDKYYSDSGRYPDALGDLVAKRYLRNIPDDPITQSSATWVALPPADPQKGAVFDVKSGAKGAGRDGKPYEQW